MVKIVPFEVEQWMDKYETTPDVLNIAETCAASVSLQDLVVFSGSELPATPFQMTKKMTYGEIRGSDTIRKRVAEQYSKSASTELPASNVIITQGAIVANFLLLYTLIGPGDHVICVYPTYQQLYAVPESLGAEVSKWMLLPESGYVPDPKELVKMARSNTKMIIINNPNNPTGALIPELVLRDIVEFAKSRGIMVLCDEVYRPLCHGISEDEVPPSILSFGYEKTISTCSMSKAYALAGIRIGWIASRDTSILEAIASARDYTTISVSQLDDQVACYALSQQVLPALMRRNMALAKTNAGMLSSFVRKHSAVCSWRLEPVAGTTAFIQFQQGGVPIDDEKFCVDVLETTKVMFLPGSRCFGHNQDFKGYIRIGYVCETAVLQEALERLGQYVERNLAS